MSLQLPVAVSLEGWKAKALAGDAPKDVLLAKTYTPDSIKSDIPNRQVAFTLSTGAVDREKDTLNPAGWDFEAYRKNPVILWAHEGKSLPIGRAVSTRAEGGVVLSVHEYVPAEVNPFADTVFKMIAGGFLKAVSPGFRPNEWEINTERGGVDFKSQELLEQSIVPIPANADALRHAKDAGIDMGPYEAWVLQNMAFLKGPGVWVSADVAEKMLEKLHDPKRSISVPAVPSRQEVGSGEEGHTTAGAEALPDVRKFMGEALAEPMTTAQTLADRVARDEAEDTYWKLRRAFLDSLDSIVRSDSEEKAQLINRSVVEFVAALQVLMPNLVPEKAATILQDVQSIGQGIGSDALTYLEIKVDEASHQKETSEGSVIILAPENPETGVSCEQIAKMVEEAFDHQRMVTTGKLPD